MYKRLVNKIHILLVKKRSLRFGEGQIGVGGNTYFWSGPARTHTHGAAFADWLLPAVDNIRCISDRLMEPTAQELNGRPDSGLSVCPYQYGGQGDKDRFYQQLEFVVEACPAGETPLVLGYFNSVVRSSRAGYEGVVGPHGSSVRTDNG